MLQGFCSRAGCLNPRLRRCEKIAAPPPAVRKGLALPDLRFKIKLFGVQPLAGKPEAFRTVPVGLWADPVVTRKFHVASRRINNLRELSGEQAAEPQDPATSDFFTPS